MALLTIEEILNHEFTKTKFKEGFDADEVDSFLDRVIETMVFMQEENTTLKSKLEEAERRLSENGESVSVASEGAGEQLGSSHTVSEHIEGGERVEADHVETAIQAAPVQAAAPVQPAVGSEPESATSMLALAQRVHDEYVRDGREEGDRIISESRDKATEIVKGAEDERTRILEDLEQKRSGLEGKIEELKNFERDYRSQIRSQLEGLLGTLEQGEQQN